jgi:hypothetical protein
MWTAIEPMLIVSAFEIADTEGVHVNMKSLIFWLFAFKSTDINKLFTGQPMGSR